jgi:beta-glucosidase-like glycosyl hydrolase
MGAVDQGDGWAAAAASALAAGCDMLLVCRSRQRMRLLRDHLLERVQAGALAVERIEEAAGRVDSLRRQAARLPPPGDDSCFEELRRRFAVKG